MILRIVFPNQLLEDGQKDILKEAWILHKNENSFSKIRFSEIKKKALMLTGIIMDTEFMQKV